MTDRAQIAAQAAWQGKASDGLLRDRLGHLDFLQRSQAPREGETADQTSNRRTDAWR